VGDSPLDDRKHLTQNYRGFSWINDRGKNSRGKEGLNLPRKRVSSRALSQSEKCRFRITIKKDAQSFFLSSRGCTPPIGGYSNNLDELINYLVSDSYKVCILTDSTPGQDAPGLRGTRSGVTSMMHTTYCANHRPPSDGATGIAGKFLEEALEFAVSARVTQGVPVKQRVCCAGVPRRHNPIPKF
jgi:hypothetical protein